MSAQSEPEIMDGKNTEALRSEVMILGHCTNGGSLGSIARASFSAVLMEENTDMSLLLIYNILIEPESVVSKKIIWVRDWVQYKKGEFWEEHVSVPTLTVAPISQEGKGGGLWMTDQTEVHGKILF